MSRSRLFSALIFLFLVLSTVSIPGQTKTSGDTLQAIEQEIISYEKTDLTLLSKARAVLFESLMRGDILKAKKILQYMYGKFDTSRVVLLYPIEKLIVYYWLHDYETILYLARKGEFMAFDNNDKLMPFEDMFYRDVLWLSVQKQKVLETGVLRSSFVSSEKDFLNLLLKKILILDKRGEDLRTAQQLLNLEAEDYLSAYKASEYNLFIRRYIRYSVKLSDWKYGLDASAGYLDIPFRFSRYMDDFALLSFSLDAAYKKYYGQIRLDIGAANEISNEFSYKGTWNKGLKVVHFGAVLQAGPEISYAGKLTFTPLVGIAIMNFSSPPEERNKEGNEVSVSFPAWAAGLNFDIPLKQLGAGLTYSLRLNVGYRYSVTDLQIARGGYTFATLGIAISERLEYIDF